MNKVHLNRKIALRIATGHPWIFANEVNRVDGSPEPGAVVEVYFHDGKFAGRGYFNRQSQIMVRLLTHDKKVEINEEFFLAKIKECWAYRQRLGYSENCRLVFGDEMVGKVVAEVQKGYYLNDKIIRFAKVVVGK